MIKWLKIQWCGFWNDHITSNDTQWKTLKVTDDGMEHIQYQCTCGYMGEIRILPHITPPAVHWS